jgi:Aminotransferase class-III
MRKDAIPMTTTEATAAEPRSDLPTDVAGWLELDRRYRIPGRYEISQVLVRGSGVRVWDVAGREYLDFESGQVCTSTGHCHPAYTQAMIDQARTLVQTGSGYTSPARVLLARKLAEIMPGNLQRSYFACAGSEATEVALRLAKLYTGRSEVVSLVRGLPRHDARQPVDHPAWAGSSRPSRAPAFPEACSSPPLMPTAPRSATPRTAMTWTSSAKDWRSSTGRRPGHPRPSSSRW